MIFLRKNWILNLFWYPVWLHYFIDRNYEVSWLFCRNYLEYVAESVADWMQEEEAKYSAHLLSRELDKMQQDEDAAAKAAELAAKKGKKSPRKSPSE